MPNEVYYILIAAKSGEAHKVEDKLVLYENRDDATADAVALREANPDQHYLIEGPHTTDRLDWKARERARLADKTHLPLIPELARHTLPEHFAHVAKGDPRSLAYTKNEADGIRDIQKRMNVAAYLEKYAPRLFNETIQALQQMHQNMASAADLLIATDGDDIQEVYQVHNGAGGVGSSCMRHHTNDFAGHAHPVQAYGDSDLAVAYTKDDHGRTTARAVVWPARKCYSRMYGGDQYLPELKRLMIAAGYKPSKGYYGHVLGASEHSLEGARIKAIKDKNDRLRYIVPYLDECAIGIMDEAREWITITRNPPAGAKTISIKETSGVARVSGPRCPSCQSPNIGVGPFVNAFTTYPANEANVSQHCPSCLGTYTFVCAGTGQRYNSNQVNKANANGQHYARAWAEVNLPMCECCGNFSRAEMLLTYRAGLSPDLKKICPICTSNEAFWDDEDEALVTNKLRVRTLDVGSRKRVVFGSVAKLIDRSYSILSKRAEADPLWGELHAIAVDEEAHEMRSLCQIELDTGMPVALSDGRAVSRHLGVIQALCGWRRGCRIVAYTPMIEALLPHEGDWVRVRDAWAFPEAEGCLGRIILRERRSSCNFAVTLGERRSSCNFAVILTDGREAFCESGSLTKLSAEEAEGLVLATRSDPRVGETVMFSHYSSPRFGQRGVIEIIETTGEGKFLTVRFPDGSTRRAAPVRLQRIGPEVMPDPTLPMDLPVPDQPSNVAYRPHHVWQEGDRVRLLHYCVEVAIPSREIEQEATVVSLEKDGHPCIIRMNDGKEWFVREGMVELLEAVAEVG